MFNIKYLGDRILLTRNLQIEYKGNIWCESGLRLNLACPYSVSKTAVETSFGDDIIIL